MNIQSNKEKVTDSDNDLIPYTSNMVSLLTNLPTFDTANWYHFRIASLSTYIFSCGTTTFRGPSSRSYFLLILELIHFVTFHCNTGNFCCLQWQTYLPVTFYNHNLSR